MKQEKLHKNLQDLVSDFGYESVRDTLKQVRSENILVVALRKKQDVREKRVSVDVAATAKPVRKRKRADAVAIVRSLDIDDADKKSKLFLLAEKYEAMEFMPNVNHARDFLYDGERDVSRIKSRRQVTVAVFRKLSQLETCKLSEMLDRGFYGPPKTLESYARAIEGFARR